jgi:hypothetical protein
MLLMRTLILVLPVLLLRCPFYGKLKRFFYGFNACAGAVKDTNDSIWTAQISKHAMLEEN